ncbi:CAP domain-containing protein [Strongyloides ratti]|uniref:CAP domain-containing protein n=1 Tax=Strongyloides ratti TaxID=34506 RepID=A0A090LGD8_STRRB|nr:CAP domain-containing protein [Strongyloides ratti]CEF66590.2 CAP domain-containing protein [Strongyloides ratti]
MNLIFITIVLIYFASQSHENVFFSVPFHQHFSDHSSTYEYRGKNFFKLKNLIRKVSLDFPEVPYKSILLKRELITYQGIVNDTRRDHRYLQVQINGKSRYITLPPHHVLVEFVMHNGRKYFICNRSPFNTYTKARIFCEYLEAYSSLTSQHRLLGEYPLASRIWRNTWRDCYYKCFSQNHFEELTIRFLRELNMIRNILHHFPIRYNKNLETIAHHHASKNALANKLLVVGTKRSKVHEVAAFASPPFASLLINRLYNAFLNENKDKNKKSKKESKQFYLLLSTRISEVGIGVILYENKLSIVLTFK